MHKIFTKNSLGKSIYYVWLRICTKYTYFGESTIIYRGGQQLPSKPL